MMKRMMKLFCLQIIFVLLVCGVSFAGEGMKINIEDKAPDFTLKKFSSDETITLSDYRGKKIVLIQFWATWCAICMREIPVLVSHYNANKEKGDFEVLAILLPSGDKDKKKVKALVKKYKIPYPILVDTDNKVATDSYGLTGMIPVIAIIDKEGIVQYEHVGEIKPTDDLIPLVLDELRGLLDDEEE